MGQLYCERGNQSTVPIEGAVETMFWPMPTINFIPNKVWWGVRSTAMVADSTSVEPSHRRSESPGCSYQIDLHEIPGAEEDCTRLNFGRPLTWISERWWPLCIDCNALRTLSLWVLVQFPLRLPFFQVTQCLLSVQVFHHRISSNIACSQAQSGSPSPSGHKGYPL